MLGRRRFLLGVASLLAPAAAHARSVEASQDKINPCNTPDPGYGGYESWHKDISIGQMMAPKRGGVSASGDFDVLFHFHGHDGARKAWVPVMNGPVLAGVTLGIGSGVYESTFRDAVAFKTLIESLESAMAERAGRKSARARRIALSAWSAGYGALRSILSQPLGRERVDTVLLLDGLHCDYVQGGGLARPSLEPFVRFARQAAAGKRLMVVSHSSIVPPGYASTTETANYLIQELGGNPRKASPRASDPLGLVLTSRFDRGDFHVRGYAGKAEPDHCAHLGLLQDILKVHLAPRWKPVAKKR
ncbi:MAG TPA: hypothetical protein VGK73_23280 [Polyangiaceae bacterium]